MGKRKTIVCIETGEQFNGTEDAANALGLSSGFISHQIRWMTAPGGMRLHAGSVNVESSEDGAAHYLETAKHLNEYLNDHGTGR